MPSLWARKSIDALKAQAGERDVQAMMTHDSVPLKRTLSALNLVALGIGAIVGAGISVLIRHAAAANAGPAITISFAMGAVAGAFAGLWLCRNGFNRADRRQWPACATRPHARRGA